MGTIRQFNSPIKEFRKNEENIEKGVGTKEPITVIKEQNRQILSGIKGTNNAAKFRVILISDGVVNLVTSGRMLC